MTDYNPTIVLQQLKDALENDYGYGFTRRPSTSRAIDDLTNVIRDLEAERDEATRALHHHTDCNEAKALKARIVVLEAEIARAAFYQRKTDEAEAKLEALREFLRRELEEINRAIGYSMGRMSVDHLVAERNALSRVLKFLGL